MYITIFADDKMIKKNTKSLIKINTFYSVYLYKNLVQITIKRKSDKQQL